MVRSVSRLAWKCLGVPCERSCSGDIAANGRVAHAIAAAEVHCSWPCGKSLSKYGWSGTARLRAYAQQRRDVPLRSGIIADAPTGMVDGLLHVDHDERRLPRQRHREASAHPWRIVHAEEARAPGWSALVQQCRAACSAPVP